MFSINVLGNTQRQGTRKGSTSMMAQYQPIKIAVNTSKHQLNISKELVRNRVLNFATTLKLDPYLNLITSTRETTW